MVSRRENYTDWKNWTDEQWSTANVRRGDEKTEEKDNSRQRGRN